MNTSRLETFSDGVLAIIITIMVLELKLPHGHELADLQPLLPVFLAYILSFQVIGTYWNNHHHLLKATKEVNSKIMWANLHLLFWLSLIPFFTGWIGENYSETWPTAMYGILLLLTGGAYQILQKTITNKETGNETKGILSIGFYSLAVFLAFINPVFSDLLYAFVACIWFIPKRLTNHEND